MYKPGLSINDNNDSANELNEVFKAEGIEYKERLGLRNDLFKLFDSL